jgi:hypothetical protein
MRKTFLLITVAAFALSGCATLSTSQKIDLGCAFAVLAAQETGTVAEIARQHGLPDKKADKVAKIAAQGGNVISAICDAATMTMPMQGM